MGESPTAGAQAAVAVRPSGVCIGLAELPDAATVDVAALAAILGRHPDNVLKAVRRGELPPAIRFMGRKVWLAGAIRRHLESRQAAAIKATGRRDARRPA
jgi:hypothetical protein